jgi:hypothetical protein
MTELRPLPDEHVNLWREGCAELQAMSKREFFEGKSVRYRRFLAIDKALTWRLVSPASESLFSHDLDGPPPKGPEYQETIDWPAARRWRHALIEATGLTPKKFEVAHGPAFQHCVESTEARMAAPRNVAGRGRAAGKAPT